MTAIGPLRAESASQVMLSILCFALALHFGFFFSFRLSFWPQRDRRKVGNIIQLIFYLLNFWHPLASPPPRQTQNFHFINWQFVLFTDLLPPPPPLLRRAEIIIYFSYSQLGNRNQRTQVESSALFRNLADSEQGLRCEHKTEKRDKTREDKKRRERIIYFVRNFWS